MCILTTDVHACGHNVPREHPEICDAAMAMALANTHQHQQPYQKSQYCQPQPKSHSQHPSTRRPCTTVHRTAHRTDLCGPCAVALRGWNPSQGQGQGQRQRSELRQTHVYFSPRQHHQRRRRRQQQQQQQQHYPQDVSMGMDMDLDTGMDMSGWAGDETESGDDSSDTWDGNWNLAAALQTWDDVFREAGGLERFERQW